MALAQVQLPHNLDAILKEGDSQIDTSSDNLMEQLQGGICLNQNKLARFYAPTPSRFLQGVSPSFGEMIHFTGSGLAGQTQKSI
ncbi:hypothetical protein Patl1_11874 [Pistacia atlantica]|uniref:Uncharacterized protein n=1 Tax=Pistacia atlantica TaxID=434234 RepID=A0ACC1A8L5_9ROSI|nr:hypothetical protein Patl1_11874 [Pistacia atlantica]